MNKLTEIDCERVNQMCLVSRLGSDKFVTYSGSEISAMIATQCGKCGKEKERCALADELVVAE